MQHLDEGTIHSWLDGALSAEEAARVGAHVEGCPQCATAVAEARGFIAASSRILTGLDNVPRGVMPIGARGKPRNWAVWRAAAAVLVVAVGSFAVLRGRIVPLRSVPEDATTSARNPAADVATDRASAITIPSESLPPNGVPTAKVLAKPTMPARAANPLAFGKIDNQVTLGKERASAPAVVSQPPAAEPLSGRAAGAAPSVVAGGAAMSVASASPTSIRVIGTSRVIGEKRTWYEVVPGDTVLLAEATRMELSDVVVTGAATTRVAQSTDTSNARQTKLRGVSSLPAASDAQRSAATLQAPTAPAAATTTPAPSVETLNGITTMTWIDAATGSTMKLSGRHTAAKLLEIKRGIEQLRAAEAAAKKKP